MAKLLSNRPPILLAAHIAATSARSRHDREPDASTHGARPKAVAWQAAGRSVYYVAGAFAALLLVGLLAQRGKAVLGGAAGAGGGSTNARRLRLQSGGEEGRSLVGHGGGSGAADAASSRTAIMPATATMSSTFRSDDGEYI